MKRADVARTMLLIVVLTVVRCAAAQSDKTPAAKPKLVVQITMDQLRGDLLWDYRRVLTRGFNRLESGGYWVRHGDVNFAPTLSFLGHTTLATGMYPSHHGLTANEWWMQKGDKWQEVDVSSDERYRIVGSPDSRIGASPQNLLTTTIGEWILKAAPGAKAIALGTGQPIPIAYAGHAGTAVWFDSTLNQFTTSTFYARSLPSWVTSFNQTKLPEFESREWTLRVPQKYVALSRQERTYEDGLNGRFPHEYAKESTSPRASEPVPYPRWFSETPMKDEALFALAEEAVDAEQLGRRDVTDYLAVDVDATDSVGHRYGVRSLEQLDTLVRLDQALDHFLRHLDATVGKGNYVIALSADHGVVDLPQDYPHGHRVKMAEIEQLLDRVEDVARKSKPEDVVRNVVAVLRSASFIAAVYTQDDLAHGSGDAYLQCYARGSRPGFTTDFPLWTDKRRDFHPARYGIEVRFKEGMILDAATGVHGSPYALDRDVPIIFYGAGIRHGARLQGAKSVDVAPTLAAAARVVAPSNLDGRPLDFALAAGRKKSRSVLSGGAISKR